MNLLLFKVSNLGENLLFLPVVQELRRRFPTAAITLFTGTDSAALYGGNLAPQRIHALDRGQFNSSWRNPLNILRFWGKARMARADACLLAPDQGNVAHLLAYLTAHQPHIGSSDIPMRVPTHFARTVTYPGHGSLAQMHWEMGRALSVELGRYDWPSQALAPELSHLLNSRPKTGPRVVIDAGARNDYARWSLDRFATLARRLRPDVEITWIESWSSPARHLPEQTQIVSMSDLGAVVSEIQAADLYIGNHVDTAQIAAALGIPTLILAGPTHYEYDPPWSPKTTVILRAPGLRCLPCESHRHKPCVCSYQADPQACLLHWSVDEVISHAKRLLHRAPTPK